jgi:hypothetical protein
MNLFLSLQTLLEIVFETKCRGVYFRIGEVETVHYKVSASLRLLFNILDLGGLALRYNVRVSERVRPLFCL